MSASEHMSLTSEWVFNVGRENAAIEALKKVAHDTQLHEPDTLAYLSHNPYKNVGDLQSLPRSDPQSILFFEIHKNATAFHAHVSGQISTALAQKDGNLFHCVNGKPYMTVNFLSRRAGFVRSDQASIRHG